jgi:YidC/Oxa1 family membrane protein insertase
VGTLGMTQWRKKMENKNVLAAVVLSTVIIMMWQFWYGEPVPQNQNQEQVQEQQLKGYKPLAPAISQKKIETKLTRSDAINEDDRLIIENKNIKGSISLTGALIDDLTLKNYNQENNSDTKKVILLNPKKYEKHIF